MTIDYNDPQSYEAGGPIHKAELAKLAPEGHSKINTDEMSVYCPWSAKRVDLVSNHNGWDVCPGCLRPVNLEVLAPWLFEDYEARGHGPNRYPSVIRDGWGRPIDVS